MARICLGHVLHPYPWTAIATVGLPSCVTPSLDYYPVGSHAPPPAPHPSEEACGLKGGFGWLASRTSSGSLRCRYGNINPLSIDYACRPRLRSRLTLGGLACPRNPWSFGGQGSHLPYRYSCLHSHSHTLHSSITRLLHRMQDAPLPSQQSWLPRLRRCA